MPSTRPCVPSHGDPTACIAALLYGTACCPDGTCWSCREAERRMLAWGFAPERVSEQLLRTWFDVVLACPVCGCAAPPPATAREALPVLDRSHLTKSGSHRCRSCERRLAPHQRHFCDGECRMQWRRAVEGWGATSGSSSPRRAARMGRAE